MKILHNHRAHAFQHDGKKEFPFISAFRFAVPFAQYRITDQSPKFLRPVGIHDPHLDNKRNSALFP